MGREAAFASTRSQDAEPMVRGSGVAERLRGRIQRGQIVAKCEGGALTMQASGGVSWREIRSGGKRGIPVHRLYEVGAGVYADYLSSLAAFEREAVGQTEGRIESRS